MGQGGGSAVPQKFGHCPYIENNVFKNVDSITNGRHPL
ncbi:MAG: hypothetical protein H6Q70_2530 [Firmicutes bacterium]|nr:hypothetical protein [Bacillota bacterium]